MCAIKKKHAYALLTQYNLQVLPITCVTMTHIHLIFYFIHVVSFSLSTKSNLGIVYSLNVKKVKKHGSKGREWFDNNSLAIQNICVEEINDMY